jgi:hypothetical protein
MEPGILFLYVDLLSCLSLFLLLPMKQVAFRPYFCSFLPTLHSPYFIPLCFIPGIQGPAAGRSELFNLGSLHPSSSIPHVLAS